jgi:sugar phosphate permease
MTEGETGTIRVNLTNVGNADAVAPRVDFFTLSSSGQKDKIGESSSMTVKGVSNSTLMPGFYGLIEYRWTPGGRGNFTIVATAVVDNEVNTGDNTFTTAVTVNEAAWKAIALYGGIFAVIIVVIVLYYYRKRLPKLGGSGKKEKPAKEEPKKPAKEEPKKPADEKKGKK